LNLPYFNLVNFSDEGIDLGNIDTRKISRDLLLEYLKEMVDQSLKALTEVINEDLVYELAAPRLSELFESKQDVIVKYKIDEFLRAY
jgi:hypothetical protein